jgi:hypothetical protein
MIVLNARLGKARHLNKKVILMKKYIPKKVMALVFVCSLNSVQAATITVDLPGNTPLNYTTAVGSTFDANIYVSGVPDFGGFDFSVSFDSTKFSLVAANPFTSAYVFGHDGTEADPTSTTSPTAIFGDYLTSPGKFYLSETINAQSNNALIVGLSVANQPPLLLGTLHFIAENTVVKSTVGITGGIADVNPVISAFDPATTYPLSLQGAFVTINQPAVVPLPEAAWLFVTGLLTALGLRNSKAGVPA